MDYMYLYYFTQDHSFPFFIQYGTHTDNMPEHFHYDFFELVIVLNGTATHIVNSEESFIKKGDVFVFNNDISHGYKDPHNFKIINIMYRPERLHEICNDIKKSSGYQALFVLEPFYRKKHSFSNTLSLPISSLEYVAELGAGINEEYQNRHQGYQTMIYSHFMEMVVFLSREYAILNEHSQDMLMHLAKAISFLEDNYLTPIKLEKLADEAHLSVRHFNRIFKENYGTTPINYILQLRLNHACSLLKKSKFCIADVAAESGFEDSNYFSRQFKKFIGIAPREYKKNHKTR
jgi:AraC-like DNA-binding protein